jgi:hypothetical protein
VQHDSYATFVANTHRRGATKQPVLSIGAASARAIVQTLSDDADDTRMGEIAAEARRYLPAVCAELDGLREALACSPVSMARRAVLFGISTPKRSEEHSIGWSVAAEPYLGILSAEDMVRISYPSPKHGTPCRMGFQEQLERSVSDALALLGSHPLPDRIDRASLLAVRGVGPKVASMIAAVCNPDARVFTVDMWHGRQLLWAAGLPYQASVGIDASAYPILEACWLRYADASFPGIPMWAVQWATWCAADGRFVSHEALWKGL